MPVLIDDSLDSAVLYDRCASLTGGQVSFTSPHLIGADQAAELKNIDIEQNGVARTRRGLRLVEVVPNVQSPWIQALTYYDVPGRERMAVIAGGRLYEWSEQNNSWSGGAEVLDSGFNRKPVDMVQGIDRLYIACGENVKSWDGSSLETLINAPSGTLALWFTNRLFVAGITGVSDQLDASDFLDASAWNSSLQSIRVGAGEGDAIIGLAPWIQNRLLVLKRGSIWIVNAEPTQQMADWTIDLVHRRIGCIAKKTISQVGQDVWFLSDTGVRSIAKTVGTDLNAIGPALSYPVQDIIDRINQNAASRSTAIFWSNRYILSIPLDSSAYPNYVLVFNVNTGSWSGYWTGWNATALAIGAFNGVAKLFTGTNDGRFMEWLDWLTASSDVTGMWQDQSIGGIDLPEDLPFDLGDGFGNYESLILTRAFQCAEPTNQKLGQHFELEWQLSEALVDVELRLDQSRESTALTDLQTILDSLALPQDLDFQLPIEGTYRYASDLMQFETWREIQFRLRAAGGKMAFRSLLLSAFLDLMDLEGPAQTITLPTPNQPPSITIDGISD